MEVLLGLSGKADDDVGGDGRVRDAGANAVEDAEELLGAVGAAHGLEDAVGARLQRHVQLGHDRGRVGHRVDDVVGERSRMRAREADALKAVDLAGRAEQLAERLTVAELDAIGVDVLPEQRDLDRAVVDEGLDLGEDVAGPPVFLLAPQRRDDAERAGVVAADGDGHPSAVARIALRRQRGGEDLERVEDLELRLVVVACTLEQARERPHVVRAEDDVDPWRLLEDDVLVLLREAAAHRDLHAGVAALDAREVTQVAVELVVSVLADGARVDDHDVGLGAVGRHVARGFE
ncbi:hypothetical protein QFZ29_001216 [Agromyces albus]|nr:hypothetical protein [Agromyces albus]